MTGPKDTLWGVEGESRRCLTEAECVIRYLELNRSRPLPRTLTLHAYRRVKPEFPEGFGATVLRQALDSIESRYGTGSIEPSLDMSYAADQFLEAVAEEALPWVTPPIDGHKPVVINVERFVKRYFPEWVEEGVTYADPEPEAAP